MHLEAVLKETYIIRLDNSATTAGLCNVACSEIWLWYVGQKNGDFCAYEALYQGLLDI